MSGAPAPHFESVKSAPKSGLPAPHSTVLRTSEKPGNFSTTVRLRMRANGRLCARAPSRVEEEGDELLVLQLSVLVAVVDGDERLDLVVRDVELSEHVLRLVDGH